MIPLSRSVCRLVRACMGLGLLALLAALPTAAQPTPPVEHFDLVLFGTDLEASAHRVMLETNPWQSDAWTAVAESGRSPRCDDHPRLRVVPDLSAARYLGQDVRENYIALKITTPRSRADGTLRAAYALPSV